MKKINIYLLVLVALVATSCTKAFDNLTDATEVAPISMKFNLNFEAVTALCADPDYKARVQFVATAKQPTLRLKLASGSDSLRQSKVFIDRYRKYCLI